jgi:hypothetical protein
MPTSAEASSQPLRRVLSQKGFAHLYVLVHLRVERLLARRGASAPAALAAMPTS